MDSGIIIALILGMSGIISSIIFGWIPRSRKERINALHIKVQTLYKDINLLYEIESKLLDELSKATGTNKETLKKQIRKEISDNKGYVLSDNIKQSVTKQKINKTSI